MDPSIDPLLDIIEAVPFPVFVAAEDGTIVCVNTRLQEMIGREDTPLVGLNLTDVGIFNNVAEYRGFLRSFRLGGKTRRLVLPGGRLPEVKQRVTLFGTRLDWDGKPALLGVFNVSPSTGDRVIEEAVSRRSVEALLDGVNEPLVGLDARGRVVFVNRQLSVSLGYASADVFPALHRLDVEHDLDFWADHIDRAMRTGSSTFETTFSTREESLVAVRATIRKVEGELDKEIALLMTIRDIGLHRLDTEQITALTLEVQKLRRQVKEQPQVPVVARPASQLPTIVSVSPLYAAVIERAERIAPANASVLITGETGTGKELIAKTIHGKSLRAHRSLVSINCGALPAELIESELFGYRKGAFTGANADHLGHFELAHQGTLFLDEIGEMPLPLQTRLLRVLQEGEFTPLGGKGVVKTDVRVIAATNQDLRERVKAGRFRADLYFRLNVLSIHNPPLRDRPEDIPHLVRHFIDKYAEGPEDLDVKIDAKDLERLKNYAFPGNVRELENMVQRSLVLRDGPTLQLFEHRGKLMDANSVLPGAVGEEGVILPFDAMQREYISSVLRQTGGKVSGPNGAASLLGLNPQTLFSKMRKLGIERKGR